MNANDDDLLKWADDARWTNGDRRAVQKSMADIGGRMAEMRRAAAIVRDDAIARRLAAVKLSAIATRGAINRTISHRNMEYVLSGLPPVERAAYMRMETVDAVDRSLRERLSRVRRGLTDAQKRYSDKMSRMAVLRARLAGIQARATEQCVASGSGTVSVTAVAAIDKKVDALRLVNREARRTYDFIVEKMNTTMAVNEQLTLDLRQQAVVIMELLTVGSSERKAATAYDRQYCMAQNEYEDVMRQKSAQKFRLKTTITAYESNRKKMIDDVMNGDPDENIQFGSNKSIKSSSSSTSDSHHLHTNDSEVELMPIIDWITGPMIDLLNSKKEDSFIDDDLKMSQFSSISSDGFSKNGSYIFPQKKINIYNFDGDGDRNRAIEAMEYVCDTLGFSNHMEVVEYFSMVKNVETRIKKMIALRKNILEMVQKNLESANELKEEYVYCLPETIILLDARIARIQHENIDVQVKDFDKVKEDISAYHELFNELWFCLDNLAGKFNRCQVPVVRKYQINRAKLSICNDAMHDVHLLLGQGLKLMYDDVDYHGNAADNDDGDGSQDAAVCTLQEKSEFDNIVYGKHFSNLETGVIGCRKLVPVLRAKVKVIMKHIGDNFDVAGERQLVARANFEFSQQFNYQKNKLSKKNRDRRKMRTAADDTQKAIDERDASARIPTEVLTREQRKQLSNDIVKFSVMPKDTDDAKRTRKPISFRKSRIVLRDPSKSAAVARK